MLNMLKCLVIQGVRVKERIIILPKSPKYANCSLILGILEMKGEM